MASFRAEKVFVEFLVDYFNIKVLRDLWMAVDHPNEYQVLDNINNTVALSVLTLHRPFPTTWPSLQIRRLQPRIRG